MPPARSSQARARGRRQPRRRLPGHDNPRPPQDVDLDEIHDNNATAHQPGHQEFNDSYASYGEHHEHNIEAVEDEEEENFLAIEQDYDNEAWDDEPSEDEHGDNVRPPHALLSDEEKEEDDARLDDQHDLEKDLLWADKWEQRVKDYHQPTEADKQREREQQANVTKILYILEGAACCFAVIVIVLISVLAAVNNSNSQAANTSVPPATATATPAARTAAPTATSSDIDGVIHVPNHNTETAPEPLSTTETTPEPPSTTPATPPPVTPVQLVPGVTAFQCREHKVLGPLPVDGSLSIDTNEGVPLTLADDICGGGADVGAFQWFSFHGTGHSVGVSTCSADTSFSTIISIFQGSCAQSLQCVTYASNGGCPNGWQGSTVIVSTMMSGAYYVSVGGENKASGSFGLSLFEMSTGCMQSELVMANGPVVLGSNVGAVTSGGACGTGAVGATKWYTFEATEEQITLSTCLAETDFKTLVTVYSGSCKDNTLQCLTYTSQGGCASGLGSIIMLDAQVGETYYVAIMGVDNAEGNFGLQVLMG